MTEDDILEFAQATKGLITPKPQTVPLDLARKAVSDLSDPPFLLPTIDLSFTPEEKLTAIEREIAIRRRVYPNRVLTRRMTQKLADQQIAVMEAIAADIRGAIK